MYRAQLLRVLGPELADEIWAGGEAITPFTLVDERAAAAKRLDLAAPGRTPLARSWKILPDVGSNPDYPTLSARDADAVARLAKNGAI